METDYLDISVPISPEMLVWSTHERVSMHTAESVYAGERNRVTTLRLTTHTGTHVDAPYHFVETGPTVDQLDLDILIGPAAVYDFRGRTAITAEMLARAAVGSVPRLLLRTDNSRWIRTGPLPAVPAHLTEDAARYLVDKGIGLVGIDGLTVDAPDTAVAHAALLRAGVIILETLDLSQVEPGEYELTCLPLRIAGVDGAPARAILRTL
jgi:arylformamidase